MEKSFIKNKIFIISAITPILILMGFDLFYIPSDFSVKLICYSFIFILLLLAFSLVFLYAGLLQKTKESKRIFKYGIIYTIIVIVQMAIVLYRISYFTFKALVS